MVAPRVEGSLVRAVWLGLTGPVALLPPAAAQLSARLDVSVASRYVWHGISRAAGTILQPSLGAGLRLGRLALEGGAVRHYELDAVASGELSEAGARIGHLGEDDVWGRAALDLGSARLHAGVVRYLFNGDSTRGGLGPGWNTTELYGAMSTTGSYLNSSLEIWSDVDRVRGTFLRYSASAPILPWPFPPFVFTFVDGDLGLNLGQGPDPSQPGRVANFAGRGVTHAGVGAGLELRSGRTPGVERTTIAVGFRAQANFDEATRANGVGRSKDLISWVWMGVTVLLGGEARGLR